MCVQENYIIRRQSVVVTCWDDPIQDLQAFQWLVVSPMAQHRLLNHLSLLLNHMLHQWLGHLNLPLFHLHAASSQPSSPCGVLKTININKLINI